MAQEEKDVSLVGMMFQELLCKRVKEAIENTTQYAVAQKTKLSRPTIASMVNYDPSKKMRDFEIGTIMQVADALDIDYIALLEIAESRVEGKSPEDCFKGLNKIIGIPGLKEVMDTVISEHGNQSPEGDASRLALLRKVNLHLKKTPEAHLLPPQQKNVKMLSEYFGKMAFNNKIDPGDLLYRAKYVMSKDFGRKDTLVFKVTYRKQDQEKTVEVNVPYLKNYRSRLSKMGAQKSDRIKRSWQMRSTGSVSSKESNLKNMWTPEAQAKDENFMNALDQFVHTPSAEGLASIGELYYHGTLDVNPLDLMIPKHLPVTGFPRETTEKMELESIAIEKYSFATHKIACEGYADAFLHMLENHFSDVSLQIRYVLEQLDSYQEHPIRNDMYSIATSPIDKNESLSQNQRIRLDSMKDEINAVIEHRPYARTQEFKEKCENIREALRLHEETSEQFDKFETSISKVPYDSSELTLPDTADARMMYAILRIEEQILRVERGNSQDLDLLRRECHKRFNEGYTDWWNDRIGKQLGLETFGEADNKGHDRRKKLLEDIRTHTCPLSYREMLLSTVVARHVDLFIYNVMKNEGPLRENTSKNEESEEYKSLGYEQRAFLRILIRKFKERFKCRLPLYLSKEMIGKWLVYGGEDSDQEFFSEYVKNEERLLMGLSWH